MRTPFGSLTRAVSRTANPATIRVSRRTKTAVARGLLILLAAVGIVGFLVLLLGPIAHWATDGINGLAGKDKADAINATRQILLTAAGGTAILIGLAFTARTYNLSRRGQLTDRYTKAIEQLASDKPTERLGGVYALEHLMRESEQDHVTVVNVLAAFIRDNAPADPLLQPGSEKGESSPELRRPSTDIQAAVSVLARRPVRPEPDPLDLSGTNLRRVDLANARLSGARLTNSWMELTKLTKADLRGADLSGARLWSAILEGARVTGAHLSGADLRSARLGGAQLQNADLSQTQLQYADLFNVQLQGARMAGAQFEKAILTGAQLQGALLIAEIPIYAGGPDGRPLSDEPVEVMRIPARGLTAEQLAETTFDETTSLPEDLRPAAAVHRQKQRTAEDSASISPPGRDK